MRILFMGTPEFAANILEAILQSSHQVVGLVCNEDKKAGRALQIKPPPTKNLVVQKFSHTIPFPVLQPQNLHDELDTLQELRPEVIIVVAYGKILPKRLLNLAPCINLHGSLLPKYRGASPIQSAILQAQGQSGITAMLMNEGLDCGDILGYCVIDFTHLDSKEAFSECCKGAKWLMLDILERWNRLQSFPQKTCNSSHCGKITKEMGCVSFKDAKDLARKAWAFEGWPGIFLENGIKLRQIALLETKTTHKEGEILALQKDSVIIGCLRGSISVGYFCIPSKKEVKAFDFINSRGLKVGDTIF